MILYFQNNKGIEREIGKPNTYEEVNKIIDKFLADHNFKSYYTRVWRDDQNRYMLDVGSHTEFFVLDSFGEEIAELKGL